MSNPKYYDLVVREPFKAANKISELENELTALREAVNELAIADGGTGSTYEAWIKVEALLEKRND